MKNRNVLTTLAVLAVGLLAASVWGGPTQRLLTPQDMPLPLYANGLGHTGTSANDWVVTAFYYPSDTVPADYNLFNIPVFAPPVGLVPQLVQGFLVFPNGNPNPVPQLLHNAPGAKVEIWFTPVPNFIAGGPPYTWTVNSMKAEGSIVGYADSFIQAWEAGTPMSNNTIVASGVMADGHTKFWVKSTYAIGGFGGDDQVSYCIVHFKP